MPSFDVVSRVDLQEVDNAVNQARKEVTTRFDFQGTKTELTLAADRASVELKSINADRLDAAYELLLTKLAKRGVPLRSVQPGEVDSAALGTVKRTVTFQQGIPGEKAKELVALLKENKLKAQGAIQADQLRVTGKSRDELQRAIALFRSAQDRLKLELQFVNFRD